MREGKSGNIDLELEDFLRKPQLPPMRERFRIARLFLKESGEPIDICHTLIAVKSLEAIYGLEHLAEEVSNEPTTHLSGV